jgi:hypothetical protein
MATPSKTALAVAFYLANQEKGVTVYAAAKQFDIGPTAIYKRLKLLAETADQRCPCCGQLVPTEK